MYPVKNRTFSWNRDARIEQIRFAMYLTIGHYLDNGNFDDAIVGDVDPGTFEIKKTNGISEMQFHV